MRTFKTVCAQGDIYIRKIDKLPAGVIPVAAENGRVIVAHSETGHNHVMLAERTKMYRDKADARQYQRPTGPITKGYKYLRDKVGEYKGP